MTEETTSREAPADVHALLERIDEAWRQLLAALDDIPEDRLSEPGVIGEWSLKDLFGHLAFWDEHAVEEIERAFADLPREDNAWQEMNDADHAARPHAVAPRSHGSGLGGRLRRVGRRATSRTRAKFRASREHP